MTLKFYVSFGQGHSHTWQGMHFDKDSLCEVEVPDVPDPCSEFEHARCMMLVQQVATTLFQQEWSMIYRESQLAKILPLFPRGVVNNGHTHVEVHE
jgi:hypothetical protein